ncbi:MAG: hypothetical protein JSW32_00925 [Deltaproteobacteria bacterium]|nr:MAG: hypothetical protein JSW32_00925 [Deltaproteobacteria bacterium]
MTWLLPSSGDVAGIKKEGQTQVYEGKKLFDYMDGGAELFLEYHFERAGVQRYQTPQGEVTVEIYQMDLPAHAFGIYSFDTQGEHLSVGQDATYERGLLTFWKSNYFIRIFSQNEGLKETLLALGRAIAQKIPQGGERSDILLSLPPHGVMQDSLLYFRGMIALNNAYFLSHQNVLSLRGDGEGITFKYTIADGPFRVIMVRYGDPPRATEAFEHFCASGVIKKGAQKEGIFLGKSRRGYGGTKVTGDLMVLVLDGKDPATIKRVMRSLPHEGDGG